LPSRSPDPSWDTYCCFCRMTRRKAVNLTDIKVNDTQEFIRMKPHQEGSLEDMWQVR